MTGQADPAGSSAADIGTLIGYSSNDYGAAEHAYRLACGTELVTDPFGSLGAGPWGTLSVSVIVPTHNSIRSLPSCLRALEASTLNIGARAEALEIVVVDDGSTDDTFETVCGLGLCLNLTVLRQPNLGRAAAMNTGCSVARGDILVSLDADMVLGVHALDEFARRHAQCGDVILIGFRSDQDGPVDAETYRAAYRLPRFFADNRFRYDHASWPANMMQVTRRLQDLGFARLLWLTDGDSPWDEVWSLPRMIYGALFSVPKRLMERVGGFDERFRGWGWEDTWVGAKLVAAGAKVIPVPSACGTHLSHPDRSPTKWQEAERNLHTLERLVRLPPGDAFRDHLTDAASRIRERRDIRPGPAHRHSPERADAVALRARRALSRPALSGFLSHALALYATALDSYRHPDAWATPEDLARAAHCAAACGAFDESADFLARARGLFGEHPAVAMESLWLAAETGRLDTWDELMSAAGAAAANHPDYAYIARVPAQDHAERGARYLRQGFLEPAWRDFAAAAWKDPGLRAAAEGLASCLALRARLLPAAGRGHPPAHAAASAASTFRSG